MVDSDDVLLLRPSEPVPPVLDDGSVRPSNADSPSDAIFALTVYQLPSPEVAEFAAHFAASMGPVLLGAGVELVATMGSAQERNTFVALPIREEVHCFVTLARHASDEAYADFTRAWEASGTKRAHPRRPKPPLGKRPARGGPPAGPPIAPSLAGGPGVPERPQLRTHSTRSGGPVEWGQGGS